jgi:A nuclease family of the HNH/ENDO VII superfamily with conserved AHH
MADQSEERHQSDEKRGFHHKSKSSDGDGGKCLNRHVSYWAKQTCSHRWQAYLHALADSSVYNWPKYKKLSEKGEQLRTDVEAKVHVIGSRKYPFYPGFYKRLLDAPTKGTWDVSETNKNFKRSTVKPYYHNAHHIVTNSELNDALNTVGSDVQSKRPSVDGVRLVRDSLLRAGYNLNYKINMIILPMDREVAKVLGLPKHLAETTSRDHPKYSEMIKKLLRSVMNDLRKELEDALGKGEDHDKIKVDLCRKRLEQRSTVVYNLILAAAKDPKFDGTLDSVL